MERVREIFQLVAGVPAEERHAEIVRLCAGDAALEREVRRLVELDAQASQEGFLAGDAVGRAAALSPTDVARPAPKRLDPSGLPTPDSIGPYRILGVLGEGGFGVVYAAERREPMVQRVAIKVIKPGMDSRAVLARFEQERQALAVMSHPCIARVLDAGVTEAAQGSRPYFVMEHVAGEPITEYCDRHNLSLRARLELFVRVCDAVQHAHHKGIIHRDIKPSNILVGEHEGGAVPKVIDFGIAKATAKTLTEMTVFTEAGQLIGTPEYMSPEQAQIGAVDIDTRTDVYSLGAVLYELLTGAVPFDPGTLRRAALFEIQRIIREEEPPKPSTRLTSLGAEDAAKVARHRRLEREQLAGELRRELDWIPLKALRKERGERYATPKDLADDIGNYLAGRPLEAGPVSAGYRLRKFVRRNRGPVAAGVAVAAALVLGVVGTSVAATWAIDQAERARRELARATEMKSLITEMLTSVSPAQARDADKTLLLAILDDASERLRSGVVSDELIAAELHHLLGHVYFQLGRYAQAQQHTPVALETRDRLLGESHPATLDSMNILANLYEVRGHHSEAESLHRRTLERRQRVLGDEHPDTLVTMNNLSIVLRSQGRYTEAEACLREVVGARRRVLGDEHPQTLTSINNLGSLLQAQGRYGEAEPLLIHALEARRRVLGDDHPDTLFSVSNMGILLHLSGRMAEAEPYLLRALDIGRRVLGGEHPDRLSILVSMNSLLRSLGRSAEGEPYLREALEVQRRVLGDEHPDTLRSINALGILLESQGRLAEAEPYFRETLEIRRRLLGDEHPATLTSTNNMAYLLESQGRYAEAEPLYRSTLEVRRRVLRTDHPDTLVSMNNMGMLLRSMGRFAEAEPYFREALAGSRRALGDDHPDTLRCIHNMSSLLRSLGQYTEAESYLREGLEARRRVLGAEHPQTLLSINNMGMLLRAQDRLAEAEPYFREALEGSRRVLGDEHQLTANAMKGLAIAYDHLGRQQEAMALWRELLRLQTASADSAEADARTLNTAARTLLTFEAEQLRDPARALGYCLQACGLEEAGNGPNLWIYLDTLALAQHATGDSAASVETQRRALSLMPNSDADPGMHVRLAEYEAALKSREGSGEDGGP